MKCRLAALAALLTAFWLPPEAWSATQLSEFSGIVQLKAGDAAFWVQVEKVPLDLNPGDGVRTGEKGKASVTFSDGSRVDIGGNGYFLLDESSAKQTGIRLMLGALRANVAKLLSRQFSVRTPTAVCSVRGTEFQVAVFEGGRTSVDLYKGLLAVSDQKGQQILLKPGQKLEVDMRGLGSPAEIPSQSQARSGKFHTVMRREMSLDMSKEEVQAAAAREIKLAEYQQGKALTDVFGNRVRLEEYIVRPQSDQFKLVVLNERKDRFDYFYYLGTFNKALPRDLSTALRQLGGGVGTAPEYFLKSFETGRSNTKDSMVELGIDGHQVNVNDNGTIADDVRYFYNAATDSFDDVTGQAVFQTLFDKYGFYVNGKLKYGWTGANLASYANATAATNNDPITGAALAQALPNRTVNLTWPDVNNQHQVIYESYDDGTFTKWDNYIIDNDGKIATVADFQGVRTGAAFKEKLLNFNYEQVITSSEFGGRKIDLVVEPRVLIQSGLIQ
ncbi:MAG: FecR domain-containing protein [Elusimicrobia bacterium]|nr:FecR domain-containing protein [Elusimicrobiota bacterium]